MRGVGKAYPASDETWDVRTEAFERGLSSIRFGVGPLSNRVKDAAEIVDEYVDPDGLIFVLVRAPHPSHQERAEAASRGHVGVSHMTP